MLYAICAACHENLCRLVATSAMASTKCFVALEPIPLDMFRRQILSVYSDIPVRAVKLGMLYDGSRVRVVIDVIRQYAWDNIVCDPVLVSTSGTPLLDRHWHMLASIDLLKGLNIFGISPQVLC
jgi:hydroxymethylpyrimidine/phosphomethylpyrimidine kinase